MKLEGGHADFCGHKFLLATLFSILIDRLTSLVESALHPLFCEILSLIAW